MPTLRILLPYLAGLVLLVRYSWFVAPLLANLRDDWSFLHLARQQVIQQQQAAPPPHAGAK